MTKNKKIVVLGAGPAGLCTGWNLAQQVEDVSIIEKDLHTGGLSHTFTDEGFIFDLGPHIIHTKKQDILHFIKKILGDDLLEKHYEAQIFFNGRFVKYPLKGISNLTVLKPWQAVMAVVDFLFARFLMFIRDPKRDDTFKHWITNRFGNTLYRIYFGPYAEKTWKLPADQISSYVAERRVSIISLSDYIRSVLKLQLKNFHPESGKIPTYYPKNGIGQISDYLEREFLNSGGSLHVGTEITEIRRNGNKFESVKGIRDGKEIILPADFVFSTIPINKFIDMIRPEPPPEVIRAANKLDFCAERLLFVKVDKPEVFEVPLLYFQSPEIKFNRVYSVGKIHSGCVPHGKEALVIEFTCSEGDEIWNATDEQLWEDAIAVFEEFGMLKREDVSGYFTKSLTHAYPRFRTGFKENLDIIFDFLSTFENSISFGRQGLFCYCNTDEAIDMGFKSAGFFHTLPVKGIDYRALFEEYLHL